MESLVGNARRHHYLPVFLMKRFRLANSDNTPRVRVIRQDAVVDGMSVHKVGLEKDFHRLNGLFPDPEGMISREESSFSAELDRWRAGPLVEKSVVTANRLIPHLRFRGKLMRSVGAELLGLVAQSTAAAISETIHANRPGTSIQEDLGDLIRNAAREAVDGRLSSAATTALDHQARAIVEKFKTSIEPQRQTLTELFRQKEESGATDDIRAQAQTLRGQIDQARKLMQGELFAILTPEQRTQYEQLETQWKSRRDEMRARRGRREMQQDEQ